MRLDFERQRACCSVWSQLDAVVAVVVMHACRAFSRQHFSRCVGFVGVVPIIINDAAAAAAFCRGKLWAIA